MSNKVLFIGLGVVVIVAGALLAMRTGVTTSVPTSPTAVETTPAPATPSMEVAESPTAPAVTEPSVKEFSMTSWMETVDGKMSAHFSLKEMVVKKGDTVRVKILNTKGTHDFVIDEFGVKKDTPEGQEVTVEFVADKAGDFEFYCSKYSHRTIGQTGTLRVTE